jgi:hypothetical protein
MKIETQRGCSPGCVDSVYFFDRPFFHKNDILKQKMIVGSESVRRNLKYTKGRRSARHFEG